MPTLDELGKLVKTKYPGAYDSVPDADLGKQIQAKFPGAYDQYSTGVKGGFDKPKGGMAASHGSGGGPMAASHERTPTMTRDTTSARGVLTAPEIDPQTGRQKTAGRTMTEEETGKYRTGALAFTGSVLAAPASMGTSVAPWLGLLSRVAPATAYVLESGGAAVASGLGAASGELIGIGLEQVGSGKAQKPADIVGRAATAFKDYAEMELGGRALTGAAKLVKPAIKGAGELLVRGAETLPGGKLVAEQMQREVGLQKLAEATGIQKHVLARFENAKSSLADIVAREQDSIINSRLSTQAKADLEKAAHEHTIAQAQVIKESVVQESKKVVGDTLESISGSMRPDVVYQEAGLMTKAMEQNFKKTADELESAAFAKVRESKGTANTDDIAQAVKDMTKGDERAGGVIGQYTRPDPAQAELERNARKQLQKDLKEALGIAKPEPVKPKWSEKDIERMAKLEGRSVDEMKASLERAAEPYIPGGKAVELPKEIRAGIKSQEGASRAMAHPRDVGPVMMFDLAGKGKPVLSKGEVPVPALMRARESISQAYYDPATSKEYAKRLDVLLKMVDSKIEKAVPEYKAYTGFVSKQKTLMEQTIFQTIQNEKTRGSLHLWVQPHRPDAVRSLFQIATDSGYDHMIPQVQRNFLESLVVNPKTGEINLSEFRGKLAEYGESTMNALFSDVASKRAVGAIQQMSDKLALVEGQVSVASDMAKAQLKKLEVELKSALQELAADEAKVASQGKASEKWVEKKFGPEIRGAADKISDVEKSIPAQRSLGDVMLRHSAGAAIGAGLGYREGGVGGAVAGGVGGIALPYAIVKIAYNPRATAIMSKFLDVVTKAPMAADPYVTAQALKAAMKARQ